MAASVTNQLIKLLSSLQGDDLTEAKQMLKDYDIPNDAEHRDKIVDYLTMVFRNRPHLNEEQNYEKVDRFLEMLIRHAQQQTVKPTPASRSPGKSNT